MSAMTVCTLQLCSADKAGFSIQGQMSFQMDSSHHDTSKFSINV